MMGVRWQKDAKTCWLRSGAQGPHGRDTGVPAVFQRHSSYHDMFVYSWFDLERDPSSGASSVGESWSQVFMIVMRCISRGAVRDVDVAYM